MPLELYMCVNTYFPKAEYSANPCLSKEFGAAHCKMKNRTSYLERSGNDKRRMGKNVETNYHDSSWTA